MYTQYRTEPHHLRRMPPLTADEERRLLAAAQAGDQLARSTLVERNQALVIRIAGRYRGRGLEMDDLIQEGSIGLMDAIARFDATKSGKFSTYATPRIINAITRAYENQGRTIRQPTWLWQAQRDSARARAQFVQQHGRSPTVDELARAADISPVTIRTTLGAIQRQPESLDAPLRHDPTKHRETTLKDVIPDDGETTEACAERAVMAAQVRQALAVLETHERALIVARFGLDDQEPRNQRQAALHLRWSERRVRRIEPLALAKLRDALGAA